MRLDVTTLCRMNTGDPAAMQILHILQTEPCFMQPVRSICTPTEELGEDQIPFVTTACLPFPSRYFRILRPLQKTDLPDSRIRKERETVKMAHPWLRPTASYIFCINPVRLKKREGTFEGDDLIGMRKALQHHFGAGQTRSDPLAHLSPQAKKARRLDVHRQARRMEHFAS